MTILFTSVGRRVELIQAFRDAATRLQRKVTIIGSDLSDTAPALLFCDRTVKTPKIADESYIPFLMDYCRENSVDILIPTIDTDLLPLAKAKNDFEKIGTKVYVASEEKVALCRDKRLTSSYFNSLGLKSPQAYDSISAVVEKGLSFPLFIKPKDGSSSINAYRADTLEDLTTFAERIGDFIIQPFISGEEYTVDIFCDWEGKPVYITPRKRLAVRSGEVLKTEIYQDERIISELMTLVEDFRPSGAITVQLIRDNATGEDWYIEINPRFGGGAPLSIKAGADSAEAVITEKSGYVHKVAMDKAVYSRFDQSVCINTDLLDTKIRGVIFDLDDTLYNEIDYVKSGFQAVARHLDDEELYPKLLEAFRRGEKPFDTVVPNEEKEACLEVYRIHFPEIHLEDDTVSLLKRLRDNNIKIGIITDGRPEGQRNKIRALGLEDLVDDIIITDELGGPQFRKPCDLSFRIMQKRWLLPFSSLLYIGDNPEKDFLAPKQLGIHSARLINPKGLYSASLTNVRMAVALSIRYWDSFFVECGK